MNNQTTPSVLISAIKATPAAINEKALPSLSCEINAGKTLFLTGLQHKLTLSYMHMLAGIEAAKSGDLIIFGNNYSAMSVTQKLLLRQQVGFVMRGGPLLSVLNGIENLKLAARYHQIADEQVIQQKAEQLLDAIPQHFDHHILPPFMNKLQRRLLAIARPLMLDPQILFLDMPFDGLGHHDKVILGKYILNLKKNHHLSLVINSDDLYFAHSHASQFIFCDYDDSMVFDNWQDFYNSKQQTLALLFESDHVKEDA